MNEYKAVFRRLTKTGQEWEVVQIHTAWSTVFNCDMVFEHHVCFASQYWADRIALSMNQTEASYEMESQFQQAEKDALGL